MNNSVPLDRFINTFDARMKKVNDVCDAGDPLNEADQKAFVDSVNELSMASAAVGAAMSARHGLLKKIVTEIK